MIGVVNKKELCFDPIGGSQLLNVVRITANAEFIKNAIVSFGSADDLASKRSDLKHILTDVISGRISKNATSRASLTEFGQLVRELRI